MAVTVDVTSAMNATQPLSKGAAAKRRRSHPVGPVVAALRVCRYPGRPRVRRPAFAGPTDVTTTAMPLRAWRGAQAWDSP